MRDYVLGVFGSMNVERIWIDQVIQKAIDRGIFSATDWRDTHTYLCAPIEKAPCVDTVLGILSVLLDKEDERFIDRYCGVKASTDMGYEYMARLDGIEAFL